MDCTWKLQNWFHLVAYTLALGQGRCKQLQTGKTRLWVHLPDDIQNNFCKIDSYTKNNTDYNFENFRTCKDVIEPPICLTSSSSLLLSFYAKSGSSRSYSQENAYYNTKAEDAKLSFQHYSIAGSKEISIYYIISLHPQYNSWF